MINPMKSTGITFSSQQENTLLSIAVSAIGLFMKQMLKTDQP